MLPFVVLSAVMTLIRLVASSIAHARGEPWTIEAQLDAVVRRRLSWRVRGWGDSKRALDEIAAALSQGQQLTRFGEPEESVVGFEQSK
jgi:hypothetical protein